MPQVPSRCASRRATVPDVPEPVVIIAPLHPAIRRAASTKARPCCSATAITASPAARISARDRSRISPSSISLFIIHRSFQGAECPSESHKQSPSAARKYTAVQELGTDIRPLSDNSDILCQQETLACTTRADIPPSPGRSRTHRRVHSTRSNGSWRSGVQSRSCRCSAVAPADLPPPPRREIRRSLRAGHR